MSVDSTRRLEGIVAAADQPTELRIKALELMSSVQPESSSSLPPAQSRLEWARLLLSAPAVLVVVGLLTIAGNFLSNLWLARDAAGTSESLERLKFQFELIKSALEDNKDEEARADALKFFTDIKLLDGLDKAELEAWASGEKGELPSFEGTREAEVEVPKVETDPNLVSQLMTKAKETGTARWMQHAIGELGVVDVPGEATNKRIMDYAREVGLAEEFTGDNIPWSSLFVAWVLKKSGFTSLPDELLKNRSWLSWGVGIQEPEFGSLAVFWRVSKESQLAHAGFVVDWDANTISILAGNSNNQVRVGRMERRRLLGIRRPVE